MLTPVGYLALFSLPLVVMGLFWILPARRAVIASFGWGWFFLPWKAIAVHGMSEYSKLSATPLSVLLAAIIFDIDRVLALRPKIWDIPMLVLVCCPMISSLHNDLGAYDGANATLNQFYMWGAAYLIGRIYFTDLEGLGELAFGFILIGLAYVPFCLYEVRMSPQLHTKIYGFTQVQFAQMKRLGGFRPVVFMQHGIALGVWMISATLTAWWLWICGRFGKLKRWRGFRLPGGGILALGLVATVVLCRALEAAALMAIGMAVLFCIKKFLPLGRLALLGLVMAPPGYIYLRTNSLWTGKVLVQAAARLSADRSRSLDFRLRNEDLLVARAKQNFVWGWGGWDRYQATNEFGRVISVPDQFWIIALGKNGIVGLTAMIMVLLLPIVLLTIRLPIRFWSHPAAAPAVVLAVIVTLFMWDCLLNAMANPMFMLACGGLTGLMPVKIKVIQIVPEPVAVPKINPATPAIAAIGRQ